MFHHPFAATVRIHGRRRVFLVDRGPDRVSVHRGRRGEDHPTHVGVSHRVEEVERAENVVSIVDVRVGDRLADVGERGEMNYGLDFVFGEHLAQGVSVEQVTFDEGDVQHCLAVPARQVIEDYSFEPRGGQRSQGVGADIAGAAGDEYLHGFLRSVRRPFIQPRPSRIDDPSHIGIFGRTGEPLLSLLDFRHSLAASER